MALKTFLRHFAPSLGFAEIIAAVLIAAYLLAGLALFIVAGDDQWDHRIKIFEALGPLVGLAAGWVFGKEVHRREAESAHEAARAAQAEAGKGLQLAGAIRALSSTSSQFQPLDDLVNGLFPE